MQWNYKPQDAQLEPALGYFWFEYDKWNENRIEQPCDTQRHAQYVTKLTQGQI